MREKLQKNAFEAIDSGIKIFWGCFIIVAIISIVVNVGFLEELNAVINGSLSDDPTLTAGLVFKMMGFLMNTLVFNVGGAAKNGYEFHIGLLIMVIVPLSITWLVQRKYRHESYSLWIILYRYIVTGLIFSILVQLFSLLTQGDWLGLSVDYTSIRNLFMCLIMMVVLQSMSRGRKKEGLILGLRNSTFLLRTIFGIGLVGAIVVMFTFGRMYVTNYLVLIGIIVVLAPNIAAYVMFMLMGASVDYGSQLTTLMTTFNIDLSLTALAWPIRIGIVVFFIILVVVAVINLEPTHYIRELLVFAFSFSVVSWVLAYMTVINLGFVKNMMEVRLGINQVVAFFLPLALILLVGFFVFMVRILKNEFTS